MFYLIRQKLAQSPYLELLLDPIRGLPSSDLDRSRSVPHGLLYVVQRSVTERIGGLVKLPVDKGREDVVLPLQLVELFRGERGGLEEFSDPARHGGWRTRRLALERASGSFSGLCHSPGSLLAQPILTLLDNPLHSLDIVLSLAPVGPLDDILGSGLGRSGQLGYVSLSLLEDARSVRGGRGAEELGGELVESQDLAGSGQESTTDGSVGTGLFVQELGSRRMRYDQFHLLLLRWSIATETRTHLDKGLLGPSAGIVDRPRSILGEKLDGREPLNANLGSDLLVLIRIRVHLGNDDVLLVLESRGHLFVDGFQGLAVSAPRGRKGDEDVFAAADQLVVVLVVDFEGGGRRGRFNGRLDTGLFSDAGVRGRTIS